MRIPRFWASATGEGTWPSGATSPVKCFGHSESSVEEARSHAAAALVRLVGRLREGTPPDKYGYSDRPIKEEILREVKDASGARIAVVTRNGYGAEVLNSANILFADIDDPPTKGPGIVGAIRALFGGAKPVPEPPIPEAVLRYADANPNAGLRIYRTRAGWRVIIVDEPFEPTAPRTNEVLVALSSDPDYVRLTRVQQCFRARLTPKPWRCGVRKPIRTFPRELAALEREHQKWLDRYERAIANLATCRFVAELGRGRDTAAAAEIINQHDRVTRATSGLALA